MVKDRTPYLLLFTLLVTVSPLKSQSSGWLHRWQGPRFAQTERTIGLMSEISVGKSPGIGLGVSKGYFWLGEGGGGGQGFTASYHLDPVTKSHGPAVGAWLNAMGFFFGCATSIQYRWIHQDGQTYRLIKPELGVGYVKLMLTYAWHRFQNGVPEGWGRGSVQLRFYHSIIPGKDNAGAPSPAFQ